MNAIQKVFVSSALLFLFGACVTTKQFYKPYEDEELNGREPGVSAMIIKSNGEILKGNKISFPKGNLYNAFGQLNKDKQWIAIDGQKVDDKDWIAYQTEKGYMHSFTSGSGINITVARLRKGKISLYNYVMDYDSKDTRTDFHIFVFEKQKDVLQKLDYGNFEAAVSDNNQAVQRLRELYPKGRINLNKDANNLKNLIEIVELYNR